MRRAATPGPAPGDDLGDGAHVLDAATVLSAFGDGRELPALAPWRDLLEHAEVPNAFLAPEILLPALRHLAGHDVRLVVVVRDDAWRFLAPVRDGGSHDGHPLPATTGWEHAQAFLGTPLVRRGATGEDWSAVLDALAGVGRAWWVASLLDVRVASRVEAAARARGWETRRTRTVSRGATTAHRDPDDRDDPSSLSSSSRRELRRTWRRLEEDLGGDLGVEELPTGDDQRSRARAVAAEFLRLEDASWKGPDGGAMARRPDEAAFFLDAVEHAVARGSARVLTLRGRRTRPAAIAALLHVGDTVSWWKIAFDEGVANRSPGVHLAVATLDVLEDPTVRLVDSCTEPGSPLGDRLHTDRRELTTLAVALGPRRGRIAVRTLPRWSVTRTRSRRVRADVGARVDDLRDRLRSARAGILR